MFDWQFPFTIASLAYSSGQGGSVIRLATNLMHPFFFFLILDFGCGSCLMCTLGIHLLLYGFIA